MDLFDRLIWFAFGGAFGFVLGLIAAHLRLIERKVEEVRHEIKEDRDENGWFRPSFNAAMAAVVVAIAAYAAFITSATNNDLREIVGCLTRYNTNQNETLTSRDQSVKDMTQSEIYLWTIYDELYEQAIENPDRIPETQERLRKAILEHRDILVNTQRVRSTYTYDDPDILKNCEERTR